MTISLLSFLFSIRYTFPRDPSKFRQLVYGDTTFAPRSRQGSKVCLSLGRYRRHPVSDRLGNREGRGIDQILDDRGHRRDSTIKIRSCDESLSDF